MKETKVLYITDMNINFEDDTKYDVIYSDGTIETVDKNVWFKTLNKDNSILYRAASLNENAKTHLMLNASVGARVEISSVDGVSQAKYTLSYEGIDYVCYVTMV